MTDFDNSRPAPARQQRGLVTEAELDKLDAALASQIGDDVSVIFNHEGLFKRSRAAITALRGEGKE